MTNVEHRYGLVDEPGRGICCGEEGLWIDDTPLLERVADAAGRSSWRPRLAPELNNDLSRSYGLPVEIGGKLAGLAAVARALTSGDVVHAQMVALQLRLPDPNKGGVTKRAAAAAGDIIRVARQLSASGLLKGDWNPADHPQWPAGAPGGIGGQFAPKDAAGSPPSSSRGASLVSTQLEMPLPELFDPRIGGTSLSESPARPTPSEIVPPPIVGPKPAPRRRARRRAPPAPPQNPFPKRPKCVREWADARRYCFGLYSEHLLGKAPYRGMGETYEQCLRGQVSEDCGGNSISA